MFSLPDLHPHLGREALLPLRLAAIDDLTAHIATLLQTRAATPLEDLGLRHLTKANASARSAVLLLRAGQWPDACILTRAIIEQLFAYLWVMQDPVRVDMVTLKQEWANAQYLEGLAACAPEPAKARLAEAAVAYREAATELLQRLTAQLGLTEKQVRTQANSKVSAKANEVQVDPRFSIPFAHYSGFVHTDGTALAYFEGNLAPIPPVPVASDLHRTLLQVLTEVAPRSGLDAAALCEAHRTWLDAVDAQDPPWRQVEGRPSGA